jgi:hypothetical protein
MATIPQLDIPSSMSKPGPWVIQPINNFSDGDPSKWAAAPYRPISNDSYRVKIGSLWAEQKGIATPGKTILLRVISYHFGHVSIHLAVPYSPLSSIVRMMNECCWARIS